MIITLVVVEASTGTLYRYIAAQRLFSRHYGYRMTHALTYSHPYTFTPQDIADFLSVPDQRFQVVDEK